VRRQRDSLDAEVKRERGLMRLVKKVRIFFFFFPFPIQS
jgi:hypothetical protein